MAGKLWCREWPAATIADDLNSATYGYGVGDARIAAQLRMLRQGSAAVRGRRDDLHVRMHFLPRLCGDEARWGLPQLWRKLYAAADTASGKTHEESPFNPAHFQSEGLRSDAAHRSGRRARLSRACAVIREIGCAKWFPAPGARGWKSVGPRRAGLGPRQPSRRSRHAIIARV
jgi:hypothetical protein